MKGTIEFINVERVDKRMSTKQKSAAIRFLEKLHGWFHYDWSVFRIGSPRRRNDPTQTSPKRLKISKSHLNDIEKREGRPSVADRANGLQKSCATLKLAWSNWRYKISSTAAISSLQVDVKAA